MAAAEVVASHNSEASNETRSLCGGVGAQVAEYTVFNVEQCEHLPDSINPNPVSTLVVVHVVQFLNAYPTRVLNGSAHDGNLATAKLAIMDSCAAKGGITSQFGK